MPPTSSESQDPLAQLASIINRIQLLFPHVYGVETALNLHSMVEDLQKIHKTLASSPGEVKVLIALHGDLSRASRPVVVKAASSNLKVFLVDHRLDVTRPVEVERVERTATVQDFREAVHDEIAEFTADARRFSSSDMAIVVSDLK